MSSDKIYVSQSFNDNGVIGDAPLMDNGDTSRTSTDPTRDVDMSSDKIYVSQKDNDYRLTKDTRSHISNEAIVRSRDVVIGSSLYGFTKKSSKDINISVFTKLTTNNKRIRKSYRKSLKEIKKLRLMVNQNKTNVVQTVVAGELFNKINRLDATINKLFDVIMSGRTITENKKNTFRTTLKNLRATFEKELIAGTEKYIKAKRNETFFRTRVKDLDAKFENETKLYNTAIDKLGTTYNEIIHTCKQKMDEADEQRKIQERTVTDVKAQLKDSEAAAQKARCALKGAQEAWEKSEKNLQRLKESNLKYSKRLQELEDNDMCQGPLRMDVEVALSADTAGLLDAYFAGSDRTREASKPDGVSPDTSAELRAKRQNMTREKATAVMQLSRKAPLWNRNLSTILNLMASAILSVHLYLFQFFPTYILLKSQMRLLEMSHGKQVPVFSLNEIGDATTGHDRGIEKAQKAKGIVATLCVLMIICIATFWHTGRGRGQGIPNWLWEDTFQEPDWIISGWRGP